jgi:RNA-directed DNA polymerase
MNGQEKSDPAMSHCEADERSGAIRVGAGGAKGGGRRELQRRTHLPIPVQGKWLGQVVNGFFNSHAVPTNSRALCAFRFFITDLWRQTLRRRSQKDDTTWQRITRLAGDWLPKAKILHPWPQQRFAVRHPRWEPYARIGPVRICAGGAPQ